MAPIRAKDPSVERTDEYEEFMNELEEYHKQRGTILEREPKVANRHLDLLRLYKRVLEEGGYDRASDTKGNALAWRRIATEFLPANAQIPTLAFLVKTAYYKNLAAYEISKHWKKEPPPKEILEDVTAKGGDLMTRTVENFAPKAREDQGLVNGKDGDGTDDDEKTPKDDKMDVDELANTPGRATRALRHAPPQRVLFQPDMTSGRQTRGMQPGLSPTPGQGGLLNGTYGVNGASMTLANYEPRPMVPSSVKPVTTPANNPDYYTSLRKKWVAERNARRGIKPTRGMMLPGTGFPGPNIYIRAQLSLQSGIPDQIAYALHHLVKISHERGDKYRFESFTGLAEALMTHILSISSLLYGFEWDIRYDEMDTDTIDVLDGVAGTPDLIHKIRSHQAMDALDDIQSEDFAIRLSNINEAALVLRNMSLLEENAKYLSHFPLTRDMLTIILNLPRRSDLVELQHYALEIAEQMTKYYRLSAEDPLYQSLLSQLDTDDRGAVMTSLRALTRISMNFEERNLLPGISSNVLQHICDWLLVDDEELQTTCLDFLYMFTAVTENVEFLARAVDLSAPVDQLTRLLLYNAEPRVERERYRQQVRTEPPPKGPPKLAPAIVDQLCQITDEREQSSQWLRTCFEEEPSGEITQIALWQAYNECFAGATLQRGLMTAKDFITNVSTTFSGANAQVVGTNPPKYTIRGISPRKVPVDARGRPYMQCQWRIQPGMDDTECGQFFLQSSDTWDHILEKHLGFSTFRDSDITKPKLRPDPAVAKRYNCHWANCTHFAATDGSDSAQEVTSHILTHLPDTAAKSSHRRMYNRIIDPNDATTDETELSRPLKKWLNTPMDERNDAAGLPLASVLVLRNLARQLAKVEATSPALAMRRKMGGAPAEADTDSLVAKVFAPVKERLYFVMAYNFALKDYIATLLRVVAAGGG